MVNESKRRGFFGEWYLEICRGGQETLGMSDGVLLPKTKLGQSRPNPGIVSQGEPVTYLSRRAPGSQPIKEQSPRSKEACVAAGQLFILGIAMAAQLIHDRVVMECLEGVWETLEGNERILCQHLRQTLQRTVALEGQRLVTTLHRSRRLLKLSRETFTLANHVKVFREETLKYA
ncbi:hypothetical protein HKD37_15G043350 [Glycine soja]